MLCRFGWKISTLPDTNSLPMKTLALTLCACFLFAFAFAQQKQKATTTKKTAAVKATPNKEAIIQSVEKHKAELIRLSDQVWAFAETALRETNSSKVLADY